MLARISVTPGGVLVRPRGRSPVTLGAAVLMIGLVLVGAAAPAGAVTPGGNGKIAFESDRGGAFDI